MACYPSLYCPCCGGVCAIEDRDRKPYKPMPDVWPQRPIDVPGPDLDRFRNYRRPDAEETRDE